MTANPVRIGVLSAASTAWRRMLPALAGTPGVVITAIASRDRAKAVRFTDRFGGEAVEGYPELIDRDDVDAVYVPLPNALHHPWTLAALKAGKHVLVEKPMTTAAGDAEELLRLAEAKSLVLRENYTFLHHPVHAAVADLCAAGRLGEVRSFTGSFCFPPLPASDVRYRPELGGGALLDSGVYPVRTAQLLFGDDLDPVGAVLRVDPETGVDVAGTALLVSAGGVLVTAEFGFQHSYASRYHLWGSTGRLSLDRAFTPPATHQPVLRVDEQDHAEEVVLPAADQFAQSAAAFVDAIRGGSREPQAGTLRTAELVDAVRAIARVTIT